MYLQKWQERWFVRALVHKWSTEYEKHIAEALPVKLSSYKKFSLYKVRFFKELLEKYGKSLSGSRVADVGCGMGYLDRLLTEEGAIITGFDPSQDMINTAIDVNPEGNYCHFDGFTIPSADEQFDLTIAVCVIQHVDQSNCQNIINEMHRITKNDGLIVYYEHNPYNPLTRLTVWRCPFENVRLVPKRALKKYVKGVNDKEQFRYAYKLSVPWESSIVSLVDSALERLPIGVQYAAWHQKMIAIAAFYNPDIPVHGKLIVKPLL